MEVHLVQCMDLYVSMSVLFSDGYTSRLHTNIKIKHLNINVVFLKVFFHREKLLAGARYATLMFIINTVNVDIFALDIIFVLFAFLKYL